jgi:HAMP domain-containing protein
MTNRASRAALRPWAPLALVCAALVPGAAQAQTTVYKCVDAQGRVEFTDTSKRGCKALDLPGYIPAPPERRAPAPAAARAAAAPAAGAAGPAAGFPRVDSAQQRARDDDRRAILSEELQAEEQKLAALRQRFNNGEPDRQGNERNYAKYQERVGQMRDEVSRSERNVEALRRELGNVR